MADMVALNEAPPTYLVSPYKTTSVDWIALEEASSAEIVLPPEDRVVILSQSKICYDINNPPEGSRQFSI